MTTNDTATVSLATLATALNDGVSATFTPASVVERLNAMTAAATDMGVTIGDAEKSLAESAKVFGCNFLNLVHVHGQPADDLAKAARTAMGWADLAGPAGSKVKTCFNTMRSRLGIVSGEWSTLDEVVRNELLGGLRSYNTVYDAIKNAEREAAKAKKAADAAAAKVLADAVNAAGNDNKSEPKSEPKSEAETPDFFALVATLRGMIDPATMTDAMVDAVNALVDDMDAAVNLQTDAAPVAAVG